MIRRLFLYVVFLLFSGFVSLFAAAVYIRSVTPATQLDAYLYQFFPLLVLILFVIALTCLLLVRRVAKRIITQFASIEEQLILISRGEYVSRPTLRSYDEIDKITKRIDDVALVMQNSFDALRDEKNKLAYILNNIGDGIFVVDENANIALVNSSTLSIFDVTPDINGRKLNYLLSDKVLTQAIEDCVNNSKNSLFEFVLHGKIYLATIKRLPDTNQTMVVLSDITENRENTKRQEEFFANASHELKTPLTAIKGFNELTAINNTDENISRYIDGISRESSRMMSLIGNMLRLSELENVRQTEPISISLAKIVDEVFETVSVALNDKGIIFKTEGDAIITSEPGHIYELVKNLVENAVRYNNHGGKVSVTINSDKKSAYLTVYDNGIGISPEEQTRIFERFYRVEKSRSVRSGGTGLGLSIVKHICSLYSWNLSLKSKLGIGTEVKVIFNIVKQL